MSYLEPGNEARYELITFGLGMRLGMSYLWPGNEARCELPLAWE